MEDTDIRGKNILSRLGLGLFFMMVVILLSQILLIGLLRWIGPEWLNTSLSSVLISAISVTLFGLPVFNGVTKTLPDSEKGEVVKMKVIRFIGYFLMCLSFVFLSNLLGIFINSGIAKLKGDAGFYNPVESILDGNTVYATFAYIVIIAPIIEEIIFRKVLLNKIRRFGDLPAILISGIAFGLFHMNLSQFFYAAVLGFFFAYITLKTNTVVYAIILHMMINLTSMTISLFMDNIVVLAIIGLSYVLAVITGLIIFIVKSKNVDFKAAQEPIKNKRIYIFNKGSMLYIGICLLMIVRVIIL